MERAGIDETFVRDLVRDLHPDLADFDIRPVPSGWDNQLWRLGDELAVRPPMTERAPALLRKEFRWLPELATRLPLPVPTPQRLSEPTPRFPRPWVIATWVPGKPADGAEISNVRQAASDRCGAGLQTWGRAGRRILECVFAFT
ncbi:phosphotransferase [Streptomyces tibetensis]|uniref:Phosphotransferase n=1 Tax=Streptomyces tibetensis TaxID=2382123 RepID=A0ABW6MMS0_9ACTN